MLIYSLKVCHLLPIKTMVEIIRPPQWYKNFLVFLPLIFSVDIFNLEFIFLLVLGFIALCLGSGGAYVFNDLIDLKKDAIHPIKKNRPLPSGRLSKKHAIILGLTLITISEFLAYFLNSSFLIINSLLVISIFLYSIKLKEIFLLDVFMISMNYVLRSVSGAFIIDFQISLWLLVGVFSLAILLSFGKRKNEILLLNKKFLKHKKVLQNYSHRFLNYALIISSIMTFIIYLVYSSSGPKEINDLRLIFTAPIFLLILFLFVRNTINGKYSGKELGEILFKEKLLTALIIISIILISILINVFPIGSFAQL